MSYSSSHRVVRPLLWGFSHFLLLSEVFLSQELYAPSWWDLAHLASNATTISELSTIPATWYVVNSHFWNEWMIKNSLQELVNVFVFKEHSSNWPFGAQPFFHWMSGDEDWCHLGASQFVPTVEYQGKVMVVLINPNFFLFLQAETRTFLWGRQTLLSSLHMFGKVWH